MLTNDQGAVERIVRWELRRENVCRDEFLTECGRSYDALIDALEPF